MRHGRKGIERFAYLCWESYCLDYIYLRALYNNFQVKEIIYVTRKTHALDRYAEAFSDMLVSVLHGTDLRTAVEECNQNLSGSNSLGGMLFRY
jgi:hypothetical protein